MGIDHPDHDSLEAQPPVWLPSPALRARLGTAVWTTLVAGALTVAGMLVELSQGQQPGVTTARVLGWVALLPALWTVVAFVQLGREVGSPSLSKSAICLFGSGLLIELHDFISLDVLVPAATVTLWVVFGLGVVVVLSLPFVSLETENKDADETTATESSPPASALPEDEGLSTTAKAGLIGTGTLAVLAILKVVFKGAFGKILAVRAVVRFAKKMDWELIAAAFAGILLLACTIWFAIAKIRLRRRLGGIAAVLGWAELLGLVAGLAVVGWCIVQIAAVADMAEANPDVMAELEKRLTDNVLVAGAFVCGALTILTVMFFIRVRDRLDPHLADLHRWGVTPPE